jgi:hypothetical protein
MLIDSPRIRDHNASDPPPSSYIWWMVIMTMHWFQLTFGLCTDPMIFKLFVRWIGAILWIYLRRRYCLLQAQRRPKLATAGTLRRDCWEFYWAGPRRSHNGNLEQSPNSTYHYSVFTIPMLNSSCTTCWLSLAASTGGSRGCCRESSWIA